jgi:hypothetical protein
MGDLPENKDSVNSPLDPDSDAIAMVKAIAISQRAKIRARDKQTYDAGYVAGYRDKAEGPCLRYPPDFQAWTLDRKNAWFAGWNEGYARP